MSNPNDSIQSVDTAANPLTDIPSWITQALIDRTVQVWQPYYKEPLTQDDAIGMLTRVGRLTHLLEHIHEKHPQTPEGKGPPSPPPR